jgi:glutamine synthetase
VRSQTEAPEERTENVYTLSANRLRRLRVKSLPGTLGEALDELEKDEVVLGALGPVLAPKFVQLHREIWDHYLHGVVTDWERATYFGA